MTRAVRAILIWLALAGSILPAVAAPAMWEARDADSRVILFGSVHALPRTLEWRTPLFDQTMAKAPLVYFETDVGPLGMAALMIKVLVAEWRTAQEPWLDRLTPEQRHELERALPAIGVSIDEAEVMPPWLVALQFGGLDLKGGDPATRPDPSSGVEGVLQWELPKERKGYFETPGQQFDMLAAGTIEEQIEQLFLVIEDGSPDVGGPIDTIIADWAAGDVEGLVMTAQSPAEKGLLEAILYKRNRNWLPVIEKMLADNDENLVIVGAGHLAGEQSVLDLLEEAGYTVNRIQ